MTKVSELVSQNVGAAITNYQTWGSVLYNVENYKAKVDGVTDDTAFVQDAIDAAFAAGGGTVFFPPGICITSGIVPKSNVNLVGIPNASIIKLKASSVTHLILGNAANDFVITGLTIDGNKAQQGFATGLDNINLTNCSQVRIEKCISQNSYFGHGVQFIGGSNNIIDNNTLQNNGSNGVVFTQSTTLRITNNRIQNNGVRGIADYGVIMNSNMYITIEGNTIINNIESGIILSMDNTTLQPRTSHVWINKNMIRSNGQYGILCQSEYSNIVNNKIISNGTANGHQGIIVQAQYSVIEGNLVTGNAGTGIDLGNCADVVLSNNLVYSNGCHGIEVSSSDNVTVTGNVVMNNNAINYSVASAGGILVYGSTDYPHWTGTSTNVTVTGNRVTAGAYQNYGIYIDSVAVNVTVIGNPLSGSGNISDIFNASALCIIKDNTTSSNAFSSTSDRGLINGNFEKAQRGVSFLNPFSGQVTLDRWKTLFGADGGVLPANITHSQQALTPGDIQGSFYYYRINVDGAGSAFGVNSSYYIRQIIANGARYRCGAGKKLTVPFWARSSIANKRIGISALQIYGTGGSPSTGDILIGNIFSLTSTWKKYTYTFTTSTLVGKTFGTNNDDYLSIDLYSEWGTTLAASRFGGGTAESFLGAGTIDIAQIDDCDGYATSFRPSDIDDVNRKAFRYTFIPQTSSVITRASTYTANTIVFDVPLPIQLRATPAILGTVNTDIVVNTVAGVAQTGFTAAALVTSSGVRVTMTKTAHGLTDAYLEVKTTSGFDAEL